MELAAILFAILLLSGGMNIFLGKRVGKLRAENRRLKVDHERHLLKLGVDPGIAIGDDAFLDSMSKPVSGAGSLQAGSE